MSKKHPIQEVPEFETPIQEVRKLSFIEKALHTGTYCNVEICQKCTPYQKLSYAKKHPIQEVAEVEFRQKKKKNRQFFLSKRTPYRKLGYVKKAPHTGSAGS